MTGPWHITLAGPGRADLARVLERDVLAALAGHGWVPFADLLALAPEGRITVVPELDGEEPSGADCGHGGAYDAGPSGKPDGGMLGDLLQYLRDDLRTEEGYRAGRGRCIRLYGPGEPACAAEIASRLGVKARTAETWRQRGVLPDPEPTTVGGRPWWRWDRIRTWAFATGRSPAARSTVTIQVIPRPARPDAMPEPWPEGAPWSDVAGLEPFRDPDVQAWARARDTAGVLLLACTAGGGTGRMYGQPPHLSAVVTDSLAVAVTGRDLAAIRAATRRGW